jgi:hypothetical protein
MKVIDFQYKLGKDVVTLESYSNHRYVVLGVSLFTYEGVVGIEPKSLLMFNFWRRPYWEMKPRIYINIQQKGHKNLRYYLDVQWLGLHLKTFI